MGCITSFKANFPHSFITTDYITTKDRSRADYAQNSLKKLLLMPIYTPLSLLRTIITLSILGLLLPIVGLFCLAPCSKDAREIVGGALGDISGSLAHLAWTPIRTTYLFFRSLYGAIINPHHVAKVKRWETICFQIDNTLPGRSKAEPRIRLTNFCDIDFAYCSSTFRVPSFLKYEA